METKEKILLLNQLVETIGLSQTEYEQWLRLNKFSPESARKVEVQAETLRIKTPLRLVYIKDDKIEILAYLDLDRKDEIWGIESARQAVKLTHEKGGKDMDWYDAMAAVKNITIAGKALAIPNREDFSFHGYAIDDFRATVEILKKHEIEADFWKKDFYWTSEEYSSGRAYYYGMDGGSSFNYYESNLGYVRVVLPL